MFNFLNSKNIYIPQMPTHHHSIMKDKNLNNQLVNEGFVTLPILNAEEVLFFKQLYSKWHTVAPEFFYKSYFSDDISYKKEVENLIIEYLVPKLDMHFYNYEALGGMFVVKPFGEKGYIPPHQDYCLVDEKKYWSLNIWCPLLDAMGENGNMQILPRSHTFMETIRGYGTPEYYTHLLDEIKPHLVDVPVKAGEAIFFFHGIIHSSTPNINIAPRVCLGLSMVQKDVPFLFYQLDENGQYVYKYTVDIDFYRNHESKKGQEMPKDVKSVEKIKESFHLLSKKEFNFKLREVGVK
jgi:hypothetical protein